MQTGYVDGDPDVVGVSSYMLISDLDLYIIISVSY